jgi:hypothetical protein
MKAKLNEKRKEIRKNSAQYPSVFNDRARIAWMTAGGSRAGILANKRSTAARKLLTE